MSRLSAPAVWRTSFPSPFANELAAKAAQWRTRRLTCRHWQRRARTSADFPGSCSTCSRSIRSRVRTTSHALLKGYEEPPKGFQLPQGGHYNKYFPGHNIAMPPPLPGRAGTYDDGAPQTMDQYSKDVAAFLMWAAEPHLVQRKRIGFQVMIFLIVLAGLMYFTKKKVWSTVA